MEWKEVGEKNKIDRAAFRTTHKQHMNPINEYLDEGKKREEKKNHISTMQARNVEISFN